MLIVGCEFTTRDCIYTFQVIINSDDFVTLADKIVIDKLLFHNILHVEKIEQLFSTKSDSNPQNIQMIYSITNKFCSENQLSKKLQQNG